MAIPTIMPDQPTGLVEVQEDGSLELILPWARSITLDEATVRVGTDPAIPVAIEEDVMSLPRRAPTSPVIDQPTQVVKRLSVREKLVVMKALAEVMTAAGAVTAVSAMPSYAPEKVHLQTQDWRVFANQLSHQAHLRFIHVRVAVERALRATLEVRRAIAGSASLPEPPEAVVLAAWDDVVLNLRALAVAVPTMEHRRIGSLLYIPFTSD